MIKFHAITFLLILILSAIAMWISSFMKTFDAISNDASSLTFEERIAKISRYTSDVSLVLVPYTYFFIEDFVSYTIINHYDYVVSMIAYAIFPAVFYIMYIFLYSKSTLKIHPPLLMPFISFYSFSFLVAYNLIFLGNVILDSAEEQYTDCKVLTNVRIWRPKKNSNMHDTFLLSFKCPKIPIPFYINAGYGGLYHNYKNNPNETVNISFKEGYFGFQWVHSYPTMPGLTPSDRIFTLEK